MYFIDFIIIVVFSLMVGFTILNIRWNYFLFCVFCGKFKWGGCNCSDHYRKMSKEELKYQLDGSRLELSGIDSYSMGSDQSPEARAKWERHIYFIEKHLKMKDFTWTQAGYK